MATGKRIGKLNLTLEDALAVRDGIENPSLALLVGQAVLPGPGDAWVAVEVWSWAGTPEERRQATGGPS